MRLATIIVLLYSSAVLDGYKFLVTSPFFGHSHVNFIGKLADILTEAGHEVHMFMPVYDDSIVGKTGVKLTKHVEIYEGDKRTLQLYGQMRNGHMKNLWTLKIDPLSMMKVRENLSKVWTYNCEKMANDTELHERLKAENYDAALSEPFIFCPIALLDQLGIRTIIGAMSTTHMDTVAQAMGEPLAPSYVPSMQSSNGEKVTFMQRLGNAFGVAIQAHFFGGMSQAELDVINTKFNSNRQYQDIIGEMPLIFTNNNPYLNYARSVIAKNIQIGGITVHIKSKPLEKELSDILNLRKHTVYISFGSVAKSKDMPEQYRNSLISVMESMPEVTFIWKYEEETNCVDHLKNVILSKWLPQTDLLADPRLSLFITHGGLGSITEVAHMGVPTIMIPIFAEQPRNAAMLARHGCGIPLIKEDLADGNKIKQAIETILKDDSYAKNAKALAEIVNNPPIAPKEIFLKHVEFAVRVGKLPQLDPYGRHLSFIQYYLIDVFAFVASVIVLIIAVLIFIVRFVIRKCYSRFSKPKKE